jgi:hypothetical protein
MVQDNASIPRCSLPHYPASSLVEFRSGGPTFSLIMPESRVRVSPLLSMSQSLDCGWLILHSATPSQTCRNLGEPIHSLLGKIPRHTLAKVTMKRRSPFAFIAASALAVLVVACSDNSTGLRATFYAQHFDSLYSAELANHSGIETNRALVLNDIEIATAFGAVPAVIPVKTATGIETWRGVEYIVDAQAPAFQFYHVLVVYRENDAHTVLELYFDSAGSTYFTSLLFDDSALSSLPDVTGHAVLTSQHVGCPSPPTLSNPEIAPYALAQCTTAQFTDSIAINFPESPVFDSSLTHLEFGPINVPGVIFDPGFGDRPTTP